MNVVDSSGWLEYFADGPSEALQAVAVMLRGRVVDLDGQLALTAARVSLHYRIPMADRPPELGGQVLFAVKPMDLANPARR